MLFRKEQGGDATRVHPVFNPGFLTAAICDTIHGLPSGGYSLFPFATLLVRTEIGLVASLTRIVVLCTAAMVAGSLSSSHCLMASAGDELRKAAEMFSAETQAFVCLPDSNAFLDNWGQTELGKFAADEQLKDFWASQQESIRKRFSESGWQLNVKFEDLTNICSGQAAMGWIARPAVTEKPFSLGVIIDIVGKEGPVEELLARIDKEMKDLKAEEKTVPLGNLQVKHYRIPKAAADVRSRESFYTVSAGQLLAADDLVTIEEFIQAQKAAPAESLSTSDLYQRVHARIARDTHEAELAYFVRPLGFGRLLRSVSGKSPRGQVDILKLLQDQGFESLLCAAGSVQFSKEDLDMHHQGFVLREEEVSRSVQILDFPNQPALTPPSWIDPKTASVLGFSWNFGEAFPKLDGIVDGYLGEEKNFKRILDSIKDDVQGPQIDIENEVIPLIGTQFFVITEIEEPITPESKRSLICFKLNDPENKFKGILDRYSKTEPGSKLEDVGNYRMWKFLTEEIQEETLDFDGPATKKGAKEEEEDKPLLDQYAITLIDGWFVFASNPDSLKKVIDRASQPNLSNEFEALPDVQACRAMQQKLLSGSDMSFSEVDLSERSFEMQYELFRQNILPQSRSMMALIAERLLKTDKSKPQQLQGGKLPPFQQVKQFFTPAGMVVRTEKDGWGFDGFILGKRKAPEPPADNE
jgi:hypothetical protein